MKALKKEIFFILLFMVIGIAVVTTNVVGNMSTTINNNPDDFLVYFSDVKVDGTQDLSLVRSEKELVFNGEFSAVGDKKVISYDVTNASKNYDAEILIDCTESTTYLNITNVFDMKNVLSARSSRTGTLTIELSTAVSEITTQDVTCTITANAVERDSQGSGDVGSPSENPYPVGKEIVIGTEKFNVISSNATTVTMLAQYNLGTNYRQSASENSVHFSGNSGWEYSPGPKEIDIQIWTTNPKVYIMEYVTYLKKETGDATLAGDLISVRKLGELGCNVPIDYSFKYSQFSCKNSSYSDWLINGQTWWTRSALAYFHESIITVDYDASLRYALYDDGRTVRPIITVAKESLEKNVITFTIEGVEYRAYEGMYWSEWVNSPFNTGNFKLFNSGFNFRIYLDSYYYYYNDNIFEDSIIVAGKDYAKKFSAEISY